MFISLDQEVVSRLAEIDMIVADLERANGRVAAVERRNVRALFTMSTRSRRHPFPAGAFACGNRNSA